MAFSVGIGLTNECNLRCPHCYRPDMVVDRLSLADVKRVCDSIPVRSMNLGVGENGLHPEYEAILAYLADRQVRCSITSNGKSIELLGVVAARGGARWSGPWMRPAVVPALPRALYIETTNRCDWKCQTCIRTFHTLEPPKDLTLAELRAIVEQFPELDRVTLNGIGEPLLNRELFAMVADLKARGVTVAFNSDAISLTAKKAAALLDAAPDEYRVSIDAATRETYRTVRRV